MTSFHGFPLERSTMIGRERDLAAALQLLHRDDIGLLTISGAGGIGKTRLAVEVARRAVADRSASAFPEGGRLVELASVSDTSGVLPAIAQALGLAATRDLPARLQQYLRDRRVLLLIDNFEHLVEAAPLLSQLLKHSSGLKLLVTSRTILHVTGEHVYPLGPLETPSPGSLRTAENVGQFAAVELFVERAQAVKPDFVLSEANSEAIAEICRRLDGLPLAIELAAAWCSLLPPQIILERLQDRLSLLIGGPGDLPARQQTLRSTIDWSLALLSEDERELLRSLAVFSAGWTIDAAEQVRGVKGGGSPDVIELLGRLVNKSLVIEDPVRGPDSSSARFRLLETVREYLLELGSLGNQLRQRHSEYFCRFLAAREVPLRGRNQQAAIAEISAEAANIRAAWSWAANSRKTAILGSAIDSLWLYYAARGNHVEAERLFGLAVGALVDARTAEQRLTLARALRGQGSACFRMGLFAQARGLLSRSIELFRREESAADLAFSLNQLAATAHLQGAYEEEERLLEESIALARSSGEEWMAAFSLNDLAMVTHLNGDSTGAEELSRQSLAVFDSLGDRRGRAFALHNLGVFAYERNDHATARSLLNGSLGLRRANDDHWGIASSLTALAAVARLEGEPHQARRLLVEALQSTASVGIVPLILDTVVEVAALLLQEEEYEQAVDLLTPLRNSNTLKRQTSDKLAQLLAAAAANLPRTGGLAGTTGSASSPDALATTLASALAPDSIQSRPSLTVEQCYAWARLLLPLGSEAVSPDSGPVDGEALRAARTGLPRHRDDLSRRETEVLRLVAGGRSNQEIAEGLELSIRTVERHISTIYDKLGLQGRAARAAATAYAFSNGLV